MRLVWISGGLLCFTACDFNSASSSQSQRSLAFVVTAGVAFEHIEVPSGSGEETIIAEDGSPPEVTVSITEDSEVLFAGVVSAGTTEFDVVLNHIWDGPSDVETWDVSITAP